MASASTPPPPLPPAPAPTPAAGDTPPQGPLDFLWRVTMLLSDSGCSVFWVFVVVCLVFGTGSPGCSSVKIKNYNQVTVGMSLQEVEAVLGTGQPLALEDVSPELDKGIAKSNQATKARIWSNGSAVIVLLFQGDKVVAKLSKGL
jgi:hypothetical protein